MECLLTGNQIKGFHRAINCLARIGNELLIEALPEKMIFRTLNPSRSAFVAITFKAQFFDAYRLFVPVAQCSVLLKAVCTVFRVAPSSMERLAIILTDMTATKLQWTLECLHGIRKTYWITCINEPDMQHVALDRKSFPSHLIVKPRDLNRLLANFQSTLQEITLIATEASPMSHSDSGTLPEGKAVELRSYIDPVKGNTDATLHTQLWIDPSEELQEYVHRGAAVDVTFSVKELKAVPGSWPTSQGNGSTEQGDIGRRSSAQVVHPRPSGEESDHTRIWSELSGSATKSLDNSKAAKGPVQLQDSNDASEEIPVALQRRQSHDSNANQTIPPRRLAQLSPASSDLVRGDPNLFPHRISTHALAAGEEMSRGPVDHNVLSRNPSNWLSADTDEEEDEAEGDLCVQSTPPQRRGML